MADENDRSSFPPIDPSRPAIVSETHIPSYDRATLFGLLAGFALIIAAIVLGGTPFSFLNIPSVLIVIGGTLAVTTICFSLEEMRRAFQIAGKAVLYHSHDPRRVAMRLLHLSEQSRRHGILALQTALIGMRGEPFLSRALGMVVDGLPGEEVESILRNDMMATVQRHRKAASILRKAAEIAPAMGLIGTLIGLVQMLGNLDDPSTIGPSMAVALLTTLYGAVLSTMVFSPLASKLERNTSEEMLICQLNLLGAMSISRQENPRRLEMLLNSILPPAQRVEYFD